jgi:hypothetical protein
MTESVIGSTAYLRELADCLQPETTVGWTDSEICRSALREVADRRERLATFALGAFAGGVLALGAATLVAGSRRSA